MRRTFRVVRKAEVGALLSPLAPDPQIDRTFFEVEVEEAEEVQYEVALAKTLFIERTGHAPRWLLIGWKKWLQLGWELSGRRTPLQPTEYLGISLVVDDANPDALRAIGNPSHLQFRGG